VGAVADVQQDGGPRVIRKNQNDPGCSARSPKGAVARRLGYAVIGLVPAAERRSS
jgi:hypothetical protein